VLVVPDRHARADAQDEVARESRLAFGEGARARVVDIPRSAAAVPLRGPVGVQINARSTGRRGCAPARARARPGSLRTRSRGCIRRSAPACRADRRRARQRSADRPRSGRAAASGPRRSPDPLQNEHAAAATAADRSSTHRVGRCLTRTQRRGRFRAALRSGGQGSRHLQVRPSQARRSIVGRRSGRLAMVWLAVSRSGWLLR
jgi:hypothetical protein